MNNDCYIIFIISNLNVTKVAYQKKKILAKIADSDKNCWKNTINFSSENQGKIQYHRVDHHSIWKYQIIFLGNLGYERIDMDNYCYKKEYLCPRHLVEQ